MTNSPVAAEVVQSADSGCRIPAILCHLQSRYQILFFGTGFMEYNGFHFFVLVNETPGNAKPKIVLYRVRGKRCYRYELTDTGKIDDSGRAIFAFGGIPGDVLHVGMDYGSRMTINTNRDYIHVEALLLEDVELTFGFETLEIEEHKIRMFTSTFSELLTVLDRFNNTGGPKIDFVWINALVEDNSKSVTSHTDVCDVPAWCFELLRNILSRCDRPNEDGKLIWSDVSFGNVIRPLRQLISRMWQYMPIDR